MIYLNTWLRVKKTLPVQIMHPGFTGMHDLNRPIFGLRLRQLHNSESITPLENRRLELLIMLDSRFRGNDNLELLQVAHLRILFVQ
jgi:hypothetical protein